jgi:hypothetical protein
MGAKTRQILDAIGPLDKTTLSNLNPNIKKKVQGDRKW